MIRLFSFSALAIAWAPAAAGAVINVPADQPRIQDAIDAAVSGADEVVVAPGTYAESIDLQGKAITVRSAAGAGVTFIDGTGSAVVACSHGEGADTVIKGFTITGGSSRGMLNNNSSPTVISCRFIGGTTADQGGAVRNSFGDPAFINCAFGGNSITAMTGTGGAVFNDSSSPTFTNCTFYANSVDNPGLGGGGGAMFSQGGSTPTLTNCVLWGDSPDEILHDGSSPATVTFSIVDGGHAGIGNVDADPQFIDADGLDDTPGTSDDDVRLPSGSPGVDAGNNALLPMCAIDLDVSGRFADDPATTDCPNTPPGSCGTAPIIDMGAYELGSAASDDCNANDLDDACEIANGLAEDEHGTGVPDDCEAIWNATQAVAFPTIQAAIDGANGGDVIEVAPGTYTEAIDLMGKAITVRSTGGAAATILDGAGSFRVVACVNGEGPDTVLDGFTITGGSDPAGGGGMLNQLSSPTVANCRFIGNSADTDGGAMRNVMADVTVINCVFDGNSVIATAGGGGAVSNVGSSPTFTNCTFTANSSPDPGRAMSSEGASTATLANCILWGDVPDEIADDGTSTTTVTFSIVEGGHAGLGNVDADPLFADADGFDDVAGNLDDDLHVPPGSPAVDAGDNAAPPLCRPDLDGTERYADDPATTDCPNAPPGACGSAPIIDMGVYELSGAPIDDCNANGIEDDCELAIGLDPDCNGNGVPDGCDISMGGSLDLNGNLVPDECDIVTVPGDFADIQLGIDNAPDYYTVLVSAGTYNGTIDFLGKPITVKSVDGMALTTIDAGGSGTAVTCTSGEGPDSVLDGFTITGGDAPAEGGGMRIVGGNPTISNCRFEFNTAVTGAGMWVQDGGATIVDCVFFTNTATDDGGGLAIRNSSVTFTGCDVWDNLAQAGDGGGIHAALGSSTVWTNCDASYNDAGNIAAGMYLSGGTHTLDGVTLYVNETVNPLGGSAVFATPTTQIVFTGCDTSENSTPGAPFSLGGTTRGDGIPGIDDVNNWGVIEPGYEPGSPLGTFTVGTFSSSSFTQASPVPGTSLAGTTRIQIGEFGEDQLVVNGPLLGNGRIEIQLYGGYQPQVDDTFEIGSYASFVAPFALVVSPVFNNLYFDVDYGQTAGAGGEGSIVATVVPLAGLLGFEDPETEDINGTPRGVAVGDLDGTDGDDVAVVTTASDDLYVVTNAGVDGGGVWQGWDQVFQFTALVGASPSAVVIGDFDGLNDLDMAVTNEADDDVSILLSTGTLTYSRTDVSTGAGPGDVREEELDGSAGTDLVVSNDSDGTVLVLENDGSGGYSGGTTLMAGSGGAGGVEPGGSDEPKDVAFIAALGYAASAALGPPDVPIVSVWLVLGGGSFGTETQYVVGSSGDVTADIDVGDMDGDGFDDILVTNATDGSLVVLLSNGDGTFQSATTYPVGGTPGRFVDTDVDGDGDRDVAAIVDTGGGGIVLRILENTYNGQQLQFVISADPDIGTDDPVLVSAGLLDGDPYDDLVVITQPPAGPVEDGPPPPPTVGALRNAICPPGVVGDGAVGVDEFLAVLAAWGACPGPCPPSCPADLDGDCDVDVDDFLAILAGWGPCPGNVPCCTGDFSASP